MTDEGNNVIDLWVVQGPMEEWSSRQEWLCANRKRVLERRWESQSLMEAVGGRDSWYLEGDSGGIHRQCISFLGL